MNDIKQIWDLLPDPTRSRKQFHRNAVMHRGIGSIPNINFKKERFWQDKSGLKLDYHRPKSFFETLLVNRRTRRVISDKGIELKFLSKLLQFCAGLSDKDNQFLTYPSPGATYPTTLFIYWDDSPIECLYRYNPFNHSLEYYEIGQMDNIKKVIGDKLLRDFPLIIYFASDYQLVEEKYGAMSYRLLNQEMGHIAQNISLYTEQEGYNSVCIGGFFQSYFQEVVGEQYDLHYVMVVG